MLEIAKLELAPKFYYKAVPVLTPHVYRLADLTNTSEYVLLPGEATMYLGTDFVGQTKLPLVADRRAVHRRVRRRPAAAGAAASWSTRPATTQGGNQVLTFEYRILLSSYKTDAGEGAGVGPAAARRGRQTIAVTLTKPKPELSKDPLYVRDEQPKNLLRWDVKVDPKQNGEKALAIDYEFKHGAGQEREHRRRSWRSNVTGKVHQSALVAGPQDTGIGLDRLLGHHLCDTASSTRSGGRVMPKARIVVVEDEPAIRRGVSDALRLTGYDVTEAADGAAGLQEAVVRRGRSGPARPAAAQAGRAGRAGRAAAGLPDPAGHHADRPRQRGRPRPRAEDGGRRLRRQAVLRPGAARPRRGGAAADAASRRPTCRPSSSAAATIDLHRREVRWSDGERCDLSETEAALLKYLVGNRERAVSREELLGRVWGIGTAGLETRAVDMHVARLRAKLKDPSGRGPRRRRS